ncbi:MAG: hypothetical protein J5903_00040 [Clostridia bacterium]|nr:hypothetical protein [Clostridia bacterium]
MIIPAILYILGIVVGIVYFFSRQDDAVFYGGVTEYYLKILDPCANPLSVLLTRIFVNAGYIVIVFVLSFVIFTYPLQLLIIIYRGAIIGVVGGVFFKAYGFYGGTVYLFVVLPQNIVVTFGLAIAGLLDFAHMIDRKNCGKPDVKVFAENCIIGYCICFLGALYEFIVLLVMIRPLNFYF